MSSPSPAPTPAGSPEAAEPAADLSRWVGRRQEVRDTISPVQVRQMAALLDDGARLADPASAPLPAGWHWLYFNPLEQQSRLDGDGHPPRGEFLPPVDLPRRMWAGSRLAWQRPFRVGIEVRKASTITAVERKTGRTGEMVFVTVQHQYFDDDGLVLDEAHDIVYREAPTASERAALAEVGRRIRAGEHGFEREASLVKAVRADPVQLFRYSAATFNGHRIHYDVDYCRDVEGYPGLVVHGPLIATLLLDWVERQLAPGWAPDLDIAQFSFRARSPTFDLAGFHLHAQLPCTAAPPESGLAGEAARTEQALAVWATDNLGRVGVDGQLTLRRRA